jgi:hypothetical protein
MSHHETVLHVIAGTEASSQFADARACAFGGGSLADSMLMVVYADHQMVLWDIRNLAQVRPCERHAR